MEHNYLNLKIVLKNYLQRKEDFIEGLDFRFLIFYSLHYLNSLLLGIFIIILLLVKIINSAVHQLLQ